MQKMSSSEALAPEEEGPTKFRRDETDHVSDYKLLLVHQILEVSADGLNIRPVLCPHCPSVILRPLSANFLSSDDGPRIPLPLPRQKKQNAVVDAATSGEKVEGGDGEVQTTEHFQWWTVTDMMQFENVSFTNAFRGRRFLACADCEIGPIGIVCDQTGKFMVSVERVRHK